MLELAILGLLKEQDLHGYELKKRLSERLGVISGVSFGSLYPALARLERAGAVHTVVSDGVAGEGGPDVGGERRAHPVRPRGGRSRKVYGITSQGETLFEQLLAEQATAGEDSRVFHLRLAFARYLPTEARIGMLERRRAYLLELLSRTGRAPRPLDRYVRSLMDHDREAAEHDLSWIERMLAVEREVPAAASPGSLVAAGSPPARRVAAPTLSALWRRPGPVTNHISGPRAPSNQEEFTS